MASVLDGLAIIAALFFGLWLYGRGSFSGLGLTPPAQAGATPTTTTTTTTSTPSSSSSNKTTSTSTSKPSTTFNPATCLAGDPQCDPSARAKPAPGSNINPLSHIVPGLLARAYAKGLFARVSNL